MVLITTAALLIGVGFICWIAGAVFGYTELSAIGAALILASGAMMTAGGLEYRTGETQVVNQTTNATTNATTGTTTVSYEYASVSFPSRVPVGVLLMLAGGFLFMRPIMEDSF